MPLTYNPSREEGRMGEQENQPFDAEIPDSLSSCSTKQDGDEQVVLNRAASNWEGYSLDILSIWFDP
jgi:hypothetical protein